MFWRNNPQWNNPRYFWYNPNYYQQYGPFGNYWGFPQHTQPTWSYPYQTYPTQGEGWGHMPAQTNLGTDLAGVLGFGLLRWIALKGLMGR